MKKRSNTTEERQEPELDIQELVRNACRAFMETEVIYFALRGFSFALRNEDPWLTNEERLDVIVQALGRRNRKLQECLHEASEMVGNEEK